MSSYSYVRLPEDSIRLLHLFPHPDENSPIKCRLSTCTVLSSGRAHNYEALSYVWGRSEPEANLNPIIYLDDDQKVRVGANLHSALKHLRDDFVERVVWVDAVCINQNDKIEKGQQVKEMAKVYAKASRVIVWLGEGEEDGEQALNELRVAGLKRSAELESRLESPPLKDFEKPLADDDLDAVVEESRDAKVEASIAVQRLLHRPWFERIWVLQEVAAARHVVIICGRAEIDGHAFCLGMDSVLFPSPTSIGGSGSSSGEVASPVDLVRSICFLIRGASFRPKHDYSQTITKFSLDIAPFSELLHLYHTRKATVRHDMVFALLGMVVSSEDTGEEPLSPDYEAPWSQVFAQAMKLCFPSLISVDILSSGSAALIHLRARVIGQIISVEEHASGDYYKVEWYPLGTQFCQRNGLQWLDGGESFIVRGSVCPMLKDDYICHLEGMPSPSIVRSHENYAQIVMLVVSRLATNEAQEYLVNRWSGFPHDFVLLWSWGASSLEIERDVMLPKPAADSGDVKLEKSVGWGDAVEKARRRWTVGVLRAGYSNFDYWVWVSREGVEICYDVLKTIMAAVEGGDKGAADVLLQLEAPRKMGPVDVALQNRDEAMVQMLLAQKTTDQIAKHLIWAIYDEDCWAVELIHGTGRLDVECLTGWRDDEGLTPLTAAAGGRFSEVFNILLQAILGSQNPDLDVKDGDGLTALCRAVDAWNRDVVSRLLETGMVDIEVKNAHGQTLLSMACNDGDRKMVDLLLGRAQVDVDSRDLEGRTPLHLAAMKSHAKVIELLLKTQKADVNSRDSQGRTPLHYAAIHWDESIGGWGGLKLLLESHADVSPRDLQGKTPLHLAAIDGHFDVVELLLSSEHVDANSRDNEGCTPLWYGSARGHSGVVDVLVRSGWVDKGIKDDHGRTPLMAAEERLDDPDSTDPRRKIEFASVVKLLKGRVPVQRAGKRRKQRG
ncbi:ankyrin repeat-containing domain protein [Cladorrhinum sp. PSN332]|nr:ankyrin repeat-containing domain protein [Cladorrhinum sp. PSN332]